MNNVDELIEQANGIMAPQLVGSDLSVLIDKLKDWVKSLDLGGFAIPALDALLHWAMEDLLPRLVATAPSYVKVIWLSIVLPLLKKIDEAIHANPMPA